MKESRHVIRKTAAPPTVDGPTRVTRDLPIWRVGLLGGVVGVHCCVGPTVLALFGVVAAGTAFVWANTLYDGYAWWFRLTGLGLMALLVYVSLRKRGQCSLRGAVSVRGQLLAMLAVATGTYVALYAVTTWLGTFAS